MEAKFLELMTDGAFRNYVLKLKENYVGNLICVRGNVFHKGTGVTLVGMIHSELRKNW